MKISACLFTAVVARMNEVWTLEQDLAAGIDRRLNTHDHGDLKVVLFVTLHTVGFL